MDHRRDLVRPLAGAILISAAGALPALLIGALAVQLQSDIGLSDAELGSATAVFFLFGGVLAVWGGRLADQFGWLRIARVACVVSLVTLACMATLVDRLWVMIAVLSFGGVGIALSGPAVNLLVAREMPAHRRGLSFGIKQTAVPLGSLFGGIAVPTIALTVGWRWAFVAAVIFPLTAIGLIHGAPSRAVISEPRSRGDGAIHTPSITTLAVASGIGMANGSALVTFLAITAVAAGLSEATAGAVFAVASLAGLAVRVASGWLADHRRSDGFGVVAGLLAVGTIGFGLLATGRAELVLPGAVLAVGAGWGWSGVFFFGVTKRFDKAPASASGLVQAGMALGAAAGPLAFGLTAARIGYGGAWILVAAASLVAVVLTIAGARMAARSLVGG